MLLSGSFLPQEDHGKGKTAAVEHGKSAADIMIIFLQPGYDDPAAAHAGDDLRHRMGVVRKRL